MRRRVLITEDTVPGRIDHTWDDVEQEGFIMAGEDTGVRVTDIQAKRKVWKGTEVPVYVTLTNYETYPKTANLTLEDTTENVFIGTQTVTIPPRTAEVVTFNWKTRIFSLGDHELYAEVIASPEQPEPLESSWRARSEMAYRQKVDYGDSQLSPRSDRQTDTALAEAYHILQEAEWYREKAEEGAAKVFNEIYDQLHSANTEELEEARASRVEAELAKARAQHELEEAEAIKAETERYAEQTRVEARQRAEETYEQLRSAAAQEAQQVRKETSQQAGEVLAEAEVMKTATQHELEEARASRIEAELAKARARHELEEAEAIKAETERHAEQTRVEARQRAEETYEQLRLAGEQQAQQLKEEAPHQIEEIVAEAGAPEDSVPRQLEDTKVIRVSTEIYTEQAEAEETSGAARDALGKTESIVKRMLFRWEEIVIILALVTAAVLLSLGLLFM